jgi:hypothetical protein
MVFQTTDSITDQQLITNRLTKLKQKIQKILIAHLIIKQKYATLLFTLFMIVHCRKLEAAKQE